MEKKNDIELLLEIYSKLKKNKDDAGLRVFFNNLISNDETFILEFTIRSECYKGNNAKYFWTTKIPQKILSILLKSPEAKIILKRYFEKEENVNSEFIKEFSIKHPKEFYTIYRESKVYLKPMHFESTSFLKYTKEQKFYEVRYETEYIKQYLDYIEKKEEYYFTLLKNFTMEEVLIHVISYFTSYEYGSELYNKNSKHFADVIHNVILNLPKILKENIKTEGIILAKMGKDNFIERLIEEFPKVKSTEFIELRKKNFYSKPPEKESNEKKIIREVIDFYIYKSYILNLFNNYSIGLYNFTDINDLNSVIEATPELGNYKMNDMKIVFEENYLNFSLYNLKDSEVKNNIDRNIEMVREFLNLYEFPKEFRYKEKNIEIEDIFKVLYNFSFKLKPLGRKYYGLFDENEQFEELKFFEKNHEDSEFKKQFDNYEICIFKKGELIKKIHNYFKWSLKYSEEIVEFLTLNLEKDFDPDDYPSKPFIYHGDYFYWTSKLLRDLNWRNILFKRIIREKVYSIQDQTQRLEKKLENEFNKNNFRVVSGYKFNDENKKPAGDLDVCAYKDGYLFLIELKMTYFTSDTERLYNYEEEQIYSYKASKQLDNGITFIKKNEEIKKTLGIENIEEIQIISLIVSNSFFSDDETFHSKHLKLSFLELIIILNNSLERIVNWNSIDFGGSKMNFTEMMGLMNLGNPEFQRNNAEDKKVDYNLWKDPKVCSGEDLYNAIKGDKIWSNYKSKFNPFHPYKISIKTFEDNYKLLHIER